MNLIKDINAIRELPVQEDVIKYKMICELIDRTTEDVEPVRHGRWIFSPDNAEGTCTYCSGKIYGRPYNNTYVIVPYKYCPHCGARMDGEL